MTRKPALRAPRHLRNSPPVSTLPCRCVSSPPSSPTRIHTHFRRLQDFRAAPDSGSKSRISTTHFHWTHRKEVLRFLQEGETHDQEAVLWNRGDKRMMEIPAASNVWWYVEVVQAEGNQLRVAYPGGCLSSIYCNACPRV